jgi:hypothetical protein
MAAIQGNISLNATRRQEGYATNGRLREALITIGAIGLAGVRPDRQALIDVLRNCNPAERLLVGVIDPQIEQQEQQGEPEDPVEPERNNLQDMVARVADLEARLAHEQHHRALAEESAGRTVEDKRIKFSAILTLQYLPELFPPALILAIDTEVNEHVKRIHLSALTTKRTIIQMHSIAISEAVKRGLPIISEEQFKAIIVGDMARFNLATILDQSPLSRSLPPMNKSSFRYRACMAVVIGYTEMFYQGFAIKLQNFMERFVAKETNSASWEILLDMEKSYRQVASSKMDGPVSFFDDGYHYLQEQFSSRMSQAYSDSRMTEEKEMEGETQSAMEET